jgi:hypothetical protein
MKQMLRMSDNVDILELHQETHRYSMQDGLAEFHLGLGLITIAGMIEVEDSSSYGIFEFLIVYCIFILLIAFRTPILEKLRRKVTYPRIGYVKVHEDDPSRPLMVVILFVMMVYLAIFLAPIIGPSDISFYDATCKYLPVSLGVMAILYSFALAEKTGDRRYFAFGLLTVTTGLIFALLEFEPPRAGPVLYVLGWGVVTTLVSLTTFIRFIRKYPIIDSDEVEASEQ